MMFQTKEDIPRAIWGNPNPLLPNWVDQPLRRRGPRGSRARSSGASPRSARARARARSRTRSSTTSSASATTTTTRTSTPYHRVGSGPWDMMDRGSFNGPGGPHNRWEVPGPVRRVDGRRAHAAHRRSAWASCPTSRRAAAQPQRARAVRPGGDRRDRARGQRRARRPAASRAGVQVNLDGAAPIDKEPACDINTNPLCDGGGAAGGGRTTSLETVQRIGYGSFEPDNGVLIAKNKTWNPGVRGTEGSQCGYNCFTWVEDAHPEDINQVDYLQARRHAGHAHGRPTTASSTTRSSTRARTRARRPSTSTRRTACTSTSSTSTRTRRASCTTSSAIQNPAGAGPQTRGVARGQPRRRRTPAARTRTARSRSPTRAPTRPTGPALHPQDETASFAQRHLPAVGLGHRRRLDGAAAATRWRRRASAQSVSVPVYVTRARRGAERASR